MLMDETKKYYVYGWFYKDSGKFFYIGKGCKYRYRSRKRDNEKLVEILNSYDCDSKILVGNLSEKEAFDKEKEMILFYRDNGHPLINIQDGGYAPPSAKGLKRTVETREKLSKALKNYCDNNPSEMAKRSERMEKFLRTDAGKDFSQKSIKARQTKEFREKQSEKCRLVNQSQEYREKQSKLMKELWKSEELLNTRRGANNCNAQRVAQYDLNDNLIKEYSTIAQAAKESNCNASKISLVASGKRKTAGGYIWKYVGTVKRQHIIRQYNYNAENDKNAKSILQYDKSGIFIREYRSVAEASRENNFQNRTNIIVNLKGRSKSAYGYVWKYK